MNQVWKRLFYDTVTGDVFFEVQKQPNSTVTTIDEEILKFKILSDRVRSSFDCIELGFGEYERDFEESDGCRINLTTLTPEFKYRDPNGTVTTYQPPLTVEVETLKQQLMTADEKYKALDKTTVLLDDLKTAKLAQLEEMCNKSIVDGFDFTINSISYRFSCSVTAQANFQGTDTLFKDGLITSAEWTVINNTTGTTERITLDKATFDQIKLQVFMHINTNISKLRNTLQPQVEACATNADVEAIVW